MIDRRSFLTGTVSLVGLSALAGCQSSSERSSKEPALRISLAQWSLHRELQAGTLDHLDFAKVTRTVYGIDAIEYVNQFFKDKAHDSGYLSDLKKRANEFGVTCVLILIDGEGDLSAPEKAERMKPGA